MNRLPLLLLFTLAGCCTLRSAPPVVAPSSQPAATQESTNTINRISIGSLNGWNLDVKVDGSGMVGYGDGDYDQFPAGTLDFKEILRVLRQQPVAPGYVPTRGTNFGFGRAGQTQTMSQHLDDRKLVLPWVKKAFDAIPNRSPRMDEIWKKYPPAETANDIPEGAVEAERIRGHSWGQ